MGVAPGSEQTDSFSSLPRLAAYGFPNVFGLKVWAGIQLLTSSRSPSRCFICLPERWAKCSSCVLWICVPVAQAILWIWAQSYPHVPELTCCHRNMVGFQPCWVPDLLQWISPCSAAPPGNQVLPRHRLWLSRKGGYCIALLRMLLRTLAFSLVFGNTSSLLNSSDWQWNRAKKMLFQWQPYSLLFPHLTVFVLLGYGIFGAQTSLHPPSRLTLILSIPFLSWAMIFHFQALR